MSHLTSFYQYLEKISNHGIRPGLDRIQQATKVLGQPQKSYPVVHVAGTNGKGSTCLFLSGILSYSGYRVGLTLSPHVYDYRERIQIADETDETMHLIDEKDLLWLHEKILKELPSDLHLTYFEYSVCLALKYFKDKQIDVAVLETGLGGRWDGTNICESILSAVTTIDYDHTEYLGETKEKILTEKLQIIKKDSDFLFGPTPTNLKDQAFLHCRRVGACFHEIAEYQSWAEHVLGVEMKDLNPQVRSRLNQSYLLKNLKFALALARILEIKRGFKIKYEGFLKSRHFQLPPSRMEVVHDDPKILIDGAHNEEGLRVLKNFLEGECNNQYDLVFGCLKNRDFLKLARMIKSDYRNFWLKFDGDYRTTPDETYQKIQKNLGGEIVSLDDDFKEKVFDHRSGRPLIVCGSFYLCAQFWEWLSKGARQVSDK